MVRSVYPQSDRSCNRARAVGATLGAVIADLIELAGEVAKDLGASVTVSASVPHDLRSGPAALVSSLEFAEAATAGSRSISLRLTGAGTGLTGQAPKGLVLTIPGETPKTVAADARAEGDVIALTLTSALVADHAEGDDVALAAFATWSCPDGIEQAAGFGAGLVEVAQGELILPMGGAPALFRPRLDTILTLTGDDGAARKVRVVSEPQRLAGGAWALYFAGAS